MEITPIRPSEIDLLRGLAMRTYTAAFASKNQPGVLERYYETAFAKAELLHQLSNPASFWYFAREKNTILGYLKLNITTAQTEYQDPQSIEIERLYIDLPHLGKGLGSTLVNFAISKAVELEKKYIWLGVWQENPDAIRFYKKHGFNITGTHNYDMIAEIQTDYLMRRDL